MGQFFNKFPTTLYTLSNKRYPDYQLVTNILFRTAFIREVLTNSSSYTKYVVRDGDTPEIIAAKVYGNPEAHWLILYANQLIDPQYDWPMNSTVFYKYMVDKYRAKAEAYYGEPKQDYEIISWTQVESIDETIHHYEKVVKRENLQARVTTETRFIINKTNLADNHVELGVPYDYYDGLADEQDVEFVNIPVNGETVYQKTYRNKVSYYTYENELNESRRNIRIVKKQYYSQIMKEFNALTRTEIPSFFRRVS